MNIISSHDNYIGLSTGHFISPTGGCKTWDEAADGYCRGEAVTSVVLKSLKAAEDDYDLVLGVILSAGTNYSANADSITRPHAPAQEELYRTLLRDAGLQYTDVDYIEMHGTGTQAGDVAEMTSVCNVFAPELPVRPPDNPLHIGAVKSNLGHSEAASGVTALIKSLMVLRDGILPPHVGIKNRINPRLPNLQRRNVIIPFKNTVLPQKSVQGVKRRILVNNFSAAGGNAAMILEDPPAKKIVGKRDKRSHHVVCISGKSSQSLTTNCRNLVSYLEQHPDVALSDLAYTTTARRIHHSLRQAFLADSAPQLKDQIARYLSDTSQSSQKKISRIALCFTGQGSFYMLLGRDLLQDNRGFREDIFRFDRLSKAHGFESFLPMVEDSGGTLKITEVQKQLSILAVEMALYRLLGSLGVRANLVIGHSLGEYGALYASGVLSASDALYLVGHRARILDNMPQSNECGMLAVQTNQENVRALQTTHGALEIACINGPNDLVLSGPLSACKTARVQLQEKSIACQLLPVTFAYHSSHVDGVLPELEKIANKVHFGQPEIPFISPTRETVISEAGTIDSSYLRDQTRRSVLFHGALLQCQEKGLIDENTVWLEIGPKPLCINMIKASIGSHIRALPALKDNEKPWATLGKLLASLYTWGYDINWQAYHQDFESTKTLLALPRYAWDNKDYWIPFRDDRPSPPPAQTELSSRKITATGPNTTTIQRLVSGEIKGSTLELVFKTDLMEQKICALITGHVMNGCALYPAVRLIHKHRKVDQY
jgi:acyl transferase domain-containing protein